MSKAIAQARAIRFIPAFLCALICYGSLAAQTGPANLIAFSRLLGYVRHFHPCDEAAAANWEVFPIEGMRTVEGADNPAELASKLEALFSPLAPTAKVCADATTSTSLAAPPMPEAGGSPRAVSWRHLGIGTGNAQSIYRSERALQAVK